MADFQINLYAFLGLLEFALFLLVVSLVFIVRCNKLTGRLRVVQGNLKKAEQLPEPVTFDHYLRDEVIHTQDFIARAAESQDDAKKKVAEVMGMRKQFLELEVEARALENNPTEFQDKLVAGLSELIEHFRPESEIVMEPGLEAVETIPQLEETVAEQRKLIDTHDAEFDRLKEVINNQQDAMEVLRRAGGESSLPDEKHELQTKLQELEKQYSKLEARFLAASGEKKAD